MVVTPVNLLGRVLSLIVTAILFKTIYFFKHFLALQRKWSPKLIVKKNFKIFGPLNYLAGKIRWLLEEANRYGQSIMYNINPTKSQTENQKE